MLLHPWCSLVPLGALGAFAASHSFVQTIAPYRPCSRHLFYDISAFQLEIAAALVGGLAVRAVRRFDSFRGHWGGIVEWPL
jgi:hypothetical protein